MMLRKTEMGGWPVKYATGERIGTVRDLVVNAEAPEWPVTALVLSGGLGRKGHLLDVPTRELEVDSHERTLVRRGHAELRPDQDRGSARNHLKLGSLEGAKVYSKDEQLLGTTYDFAIATSPPGGWLVWRFLVAQPGMRSRRLRLHVSDIDSVESGRIVLKATKDEIQGTV